MHVCIKAKSFEITIDFIGLQASNQGIDYSVQPVPDDTNDLYEHVFISYSFLNIFFVAGTINYFSALGADSMTTKLAPV